MAMGERRLLKSDRKKMESGRLGLSESERQSLVDQANQAAKSTARSLNAEMARTMMGQGSSALVSGQAAQQQRRILQGTAEAGAQAAYQANAMDQQLREARRQEILARLQRRSDINRQGWKMGLAFGGSLVGGALKAGGGAMGGGQAQGLGAAASAAKPAAG